MMIFRRWRYLVPLLILWLAFGLRLYRLDSQSIWWDEGHSIFVASHPVWQIPTLPAMDVHPPAYFSLLHLWLTIAGRSEFALRYLSVIFSLLTVALLWRFATALSPGRAAPGLAALLAAVSPMYVAYGQEVRSYAMITFFALASTYLLWRLLHQNRPQRRVGLLLAYIGVTVACLYIHYFTIFLLLFQNLAWSIFLSTKNGGQRPALSLANGPAVSRRWLAARPEPGEWACPEPGEWASGHLLAWPVSQIGILLLFLPQLRLALQQVTSYTNPNLAPPALAEFITRNWQAYTVGLTINPNLARWGMWGLAIILVVSWLIIFWGHWLRFEVIRHSQLPTTFLFLSSWLLVPLAVYFLVLRRQPSFEPRYLMLVTPALLLLLAVGITHASRLAPHPSTLILSAIPVIIFLSGLRSYYTDETFFKDDSAGVARWLAAETTPNDIVFFDVPHPFHYYAYSIPAPTRYLFVDIHTAAGILNREAAGRDRLFWVTWWGSDTDPRGVIPFLAEKAGQPLGSLDFKGYRVQWFDLPEKAHFSLPGELSPLNATFGDALRLDGAAFGKTASPAGPAWATLHFTLLHPTNVDYKVSLRLKGAAGQIVAQTDRDLLNDRHFRTSAWPVDNPALNQAINVYLLPLPPDTPAGDYRLEAVVYNAHPPYPSEGVSGHPSDNGVAAILGKIIVVP